MREHDRRGRDDVVHARAARKIADRPRETLQHRPDRLRTGKVLGELVGDVAGVEIGKHEHVRVSCDRTGVVQLLRRHGGNERRVGLQLAVDRKRRLARARDRERADAPCRHRACAGASLRGERQHRHARRLVQQPPAAFRRCERDVGEDLGGGLCVHRAVGVDQRTLREHDQEEARRRRNAGGEADRHHSRLDDTTGRIGDACDHRIGVARLDHQACMEQRLRGEAARNSRMGVGAALQVKRSVTIDALACIIPPRSRLRRRGVGIRASRRLCGAHWRIAEHDRLGQTLVAQAPRRGRDPLVGTFGKHNPQSAPANPRTGCRQNVHDLASLALRAPAPVPPVTEPGRCRRRALSPQYRQDRRAALLDRLRARARYLPARSRRSP